MEYLPEAQGPQGQQYYMNEDERNIHVWCSWSKACSSPQFRDSVTPGIVAGCYMHNGWLPIRVFYQWIDQIVHRRYYNGTLILVSGPDPRTLDLKANAPISPPTHEDTKRRAVPRDSPGNMLEGHYYLMSIVNQKFTCFWATLIPHNLDRRVRTVSQTPTPSQGTTPTTRRRSSTRTAVRLRDKSCLVTGEEVLPRKRGSNFTGFEVAHIFPLMGVGEDSWIKHLPPKTQRLVGSSLEADHPRNALLLQANVHSLFDDYQWSVLRTRDQSSSNCYKIIRFEKSGASAVAPYDTLKINQQNLSSTAQPDPDLLEDHLRTCIMWHVRGIGQRPVSGYKSLLWES